MTTISVIGAGNLGTAVAGIAAKSGAQVQILARDGEKAKAAADQVGASSATLGDALTGEIVVLAVPYPAVASVLEACAGALSGKTIVDVTNPVDFATFDGLTVPADSSAAQVIQEAVPDAVVVKAFNTNFGATLVSGTTGPEPTTVLVAGADGAGKQSVIDLVTGAGLRAKNAGQLKRARELEAIGFLQMTLAATEQVSWTGGFAVVE